MRRRRITFGAVLFFFRALDSAAAPHSRSTGGRSSNDHTLATESSDPSVLRAAGSCSLVVEVVVCGAAHRVCKSEGAPQAPGPSPHTPFPSQGSQPSGARKASANAERTNHGASPVGCVWRHHADGVPFVNLCLCLCFVSGNTLEREASQEPRISHSPDPLRGEPPCSHRPF